jgi:hypothetical protein
MAPIFMIGGHIISNILVQYLIDPLVWPLVYKWQGVPNLSLVLAFFIRSVRNSNANLASQSLTMISGML